MRKIFAACLFIIAIGLLAAYFYQNHLPFSAQIFIARHIDKPAYMAKDPEEIKIKVTDWRTLEEWVSANVHCQGSLDQIGDPKFLKKIKSLGVAVERDDEGTPDETWHIGKPLHVEGMTVSRIRYWADSGSEFAVRLKVAPKILMEKIGARPPPRYFSDHGFAAVVLTKLPTELDPFPRLVFVREDEDPGYSYMGCHVFDY